MGWVTQRFFIDASEASGIRGWNLKKITRQVMRQPSMLHLLGNNAALIKAWRVAFTSNEVPKQRSFNFLKL
jgi:hypothetical protein